jgi:hypothetical protein
LSDCKMFPEEKRARGLTAKCFQSRNMHGVWL